MRLRRQRRAKAGQDDPKDKKDMMEDIDELMRQARDLIDDTEMYTNRRKYISKQQDELMKRLR